jgi:hypothetical protein
MCKYMETKYIKKTASLRRGVVSTRRGLVFEMLGLTLALPSSLHPRAVRDVGGGREMSALGSKPQNLRRCRRTLLGG